MNRRSPDGDTCLHREMRRGDRGPVPLTLFESCTYRQERAASPRHPACLKDAERASLLTFFFFSLGVERNDTFPGGAIMGTVRTHTYLWPDISQLRKAVQNI